MTCPVRHLAGWYVVGTWRRPADGGDLERRRLAIVRALRGEPDPPPPPSPPAAVVFDDRLHRLERDIAAVRSHLADLSARLRHVAADRPAGPPPYPTNPAPLEHLDDEDDTGETPRVPPLETSAPMSDRASQALFGY